MPTIERKIEVHRLTISGLPKGTSYTAFLRDMRDKANGATAAVMKSGKKSHTLYDLKACNHRLRMRFMSYTKGHRPDILDTNRFTLHQNPLRPSETGVEWTHVLGGLRDDQYLFLIERNTSGIWPSTIETYLQWLIDNFNVNDDRHQVGPDTEPATVSLEAVPVEEFMRRVNALDRIMLATVRIVRPNPGWRDLDDELGHVAEESDAHKAEVVMRSRRKASLSKQRGILDWIRTKYDKRQLDFAAITGQRGPKKESFNTARLGKHFMVNLEVDERGQVQQDDAWKTLGQSMDSID